MRNNRRNFLKHFGGTAAAVAAASALSDQVASQAVAQEVALVGASPIKKGYVTGKCVLELEGTICGWIYYAEGGGATADVMQSPPNSDGVMKKNLGAVRYEEIILYCGAGLNQAFYNWVKALFDHQPQRKSGAIVYLDREMREISRLNFNKALITEVNFWPVDTVWNEPAMMTVRLKPETTRRHRDYSGRLMNIGPKRIPTWQMNNFRIAIEGLDETAANAIRVETVGVSWQVPGCLQVSDLVITFPSSACLPIEAWLEDFVIKGHNDESKEKAGMVEYLPPDDQKAYFTLGFEHLGIFRLDPVTFDGPNRPMHLLQAQMYCENMRFDNTPMRV